MAGCGSGNDDGKGANLDFSGDQPAQPACLGSANHATLVNWAWEQFPAVGDLHRKQFKPLVTANSSELAAIGGERVASHASHRFPLRRFTLKGALYRRT